MSYSFLLGCVLAGGSLCFFFPVDGPAGHWLIHSHSRQHCFFFFVVLVRLHRGWIVPIHALGPLSRVLDRDLTPWISDLLSFWLFHHPFINSGVCGLGKKPDGDPRCYSNFDFISTGFVVFFFWLGMQCNAMQCMRACVCVCAMRPKF